MPRVAVIGGGIIGLSIAWRLASAGCRVDVYDRGEPGRGATWAAAGMLAAGAEAEPGEETLFAFNRLSQQRWPEFARELAEASGIDVGYRDEGTLRIALNRDDAAKLRATCDFQQRLGVELEWLDGPAVRRLEPHLAPGVVAAVLSRHDHQVDNRRVAPALVAAVTAAGGRIHAKTAVDEVAISHGRVVGVVVGGTVVAADVVVLAAGAWSREITGIPPTLRPPVRPVKGQMIALRMDPAAPLVRHVVWAPRAYLVPRRDGRLLVGATVEERGFDPALTAGAMLALLEGAWRTFPGIEELPVDETWCGFRPGSRDDAPILGPCEIGGLVFATGHHRNGILLAPATADVISRLVLTGEMDPAARPFGLDRFTKPQVRRETA